MTTQVLKRLQTYDLTIRELNEDDIDKLHELSVGVRWPHRPSDWEMLIALGGKGFVGCDAIGRIVVSAMWFPMGNHFTTIGMLITSPRLQTLGAGRWMMKHVMDECVGQKILLNSTKSAYRLYESLSFQPVAKVYQHQGIASPIVGMSPPNQTQVRSLKAIDQEKILALDYDAFGFERGAIINAILERSKGTVILRDGKIQGFALCRPFGRGHVIGPVIAKNKEEAIALITPHITQHSGTFLRIDTSEPSPIFKDFLIQSGMVEYDSVTTMTKEPIVQPSSGCHCFALTSQALN